MVNLYRRSDRVKPEYSVFQQFVKCGGVGLLSLQLSLVTLRDVPPWTVEGPGHLGEPQLGVVRLRLLQAVLQLALLPLRLTGVLGGVVAHLYLVDAVVGGHGARVKVLRKRLTVLLNGKPELLWDIFFIRVRMRT